MKGSLFTPIISRERIAMAPTKIEAIMEWLPYTNVHKTCSFMSLVGYHRRFVQ